jgi:hypothetical protein
MAAGFDLQVDAEKAQKRMRMAIAAFRRVVVIKMILYIFMLSGQVQNSKLNASLSRLLSQNLLCVLCS